MYLHELPTTGEIVFSDHFLPSSSNLISSLSQATELRSNIRALLKNIKHSPNSTNDVSTSANTYTTKDWIKIVKATEEYLPSLFAIYNCLQTDDLILKHDHHPAFSWRSCFSSSSSSPRISINSIHYELLSVLLLQATSLSNTATSIVNALPPDYERIRTLTQAQRKVNDDKLKLAADLLCRAAGIFEYVASSFIPAWELEVGHIDPRPPETTTELAKALSKLALADAQTLAIRKLLSPSIALAEDTITPGPPLPQSHPSPSLLAKLHLETYELYQSAEHLARLSAGSNKRAAAATAAAAGKGTAGTGGVALGESASGRVIGGSGGTRVREPSAPLAQNTAALQLSRPSTADDMSAPSIDGSEDVDGAGIEDDGGRRLKGSPALPSSNPNKFSKFLKFGNHGGGGSDEKETGRGVGGSGGSRGLVGIGGTGGGITSSLLSYLSTNAIFARAQAYRWLAIDSGEQRSAYGEALAYLNLARAELGDSSSSGKDISSANGSNGSSGKLARKLADLSTLPGSSNSKRIKELRQELKGRSAIELKDTLHWTRAYTKLNDTITFYPVLSSTEVLGKVPAGRAALGLKTFVPPTPAFGPGSSGPTREIIASEADADPGLAGAGLGDGLSRLALGGEGGAGDVPPPERSLLGTDKATAADKRAQYAGAGQYF
ncbi:hypothetical protein OC846_006404 [Tilletia horrida]|uniref:pH-response regulator protein palC n=1 Tax=Tilletia horrida TaxID=155126 RepID=A0AAN6JV28_9BASI|nr:hypothetical protein OC846_006404 [Tilletia horrida]